MPFQRNFIEKADDVQERISETINASTEFNPNPDKNISNLAEKAYPKDKAEQERYAEKISASLRDYIKGENPINDLWDFLSEQNCAQTTIVEGILRFFNNIKKEINISEFQKNIQTAPDTVTESFKEGRKEKFASTMANLQELMKEIQSKNTNIPSPPKRYG